MIEKILPDGSKVTAFPISIPQQFMFFMSAQYGAKYPVNNIGLCCFIHGGADLEILREALYEAISRCDTMRLRFIPDEKYKILQYITPETEMNIDIIDMSDIPLEEAKLKLQSISREDIPTYNCEIHKISLIRFEGNTDGIFMRLHHFAMDAYSTGVFLRDASEIYLHKTKGTAYPKPMRPYLPVLLQELQYINSPQQTEDKDYWFRSLSEADEPIFTDYMLENRLTQQQKKNPSQRFADIHSGSPEAGTLIFSMSEDESKRILSVCEEKQLSVCAFLSMGLRTALSVFNNNETDVSFKMIVNRRGTVAEKKSGGIRINYFPMRSIIPGDMKFADAVNEISLIQNDIYGHCSLSFWDMLIERHKSMPSDAKPDSTYDSIGLSYQPPTEHIQLGSSPDEVIWFNNGASMIPLYLTIKHRTTDGGFDFIFEYRKDPDPVYDLNIFFTKLRGALLAGAEDPDITAHVLLKKLKITDEERKGKNNG